MAWMRDEPRVCSMVRAPSRLLAHHWQAQSVRKHQHCRAAAQMSKPNPVENIWQLMRNDWLSNRVFTLHDSIIIHCRKA